MKYTVNAEVTTIYTFTVEAETPEQAEKLAEDMDYDNMKEIHDSVEFHIYDDAGDQVI